MNKEELLAKPRFLRLFTTHGLKSVGSLYYTLKLLNCTNIYLIGFLY